MERGMTKTIQGCRLLVVLAAWLMVTIVSAQTTGSRKWYHNLALGVNHYHADTALCSSLNVGIFSNVDTLRGVQIGALSGIVSRDMRGLNIGTVSTVARDMRGLQIAGLTNIATHSMRGVQLSAVTNIAMGVESGVQLSDIANICADNMRGVQAGIYNFADTLQGLQVGILNMADAHPRGVQIGLVNVTHDSRARKIGLVNVSPSTAIDFLAYMGNTSKLNGAMRFRNRSTYSIIGLGTHYMGLDKKFSGTLFYRLGQYVSLSPRWTLSGDVGFYHIETFEENSRTKPDRLYSLQAHLNADYKLSPTLGLFASVGYGDTRHYGSRERYEDKFIAQVGLSVACRHSRSALQRPSKPEIGLPMADSLMALPQRKRYWLAAAEATGINLLVFSFDKFVMNEDFAQVNIHTIKDNFKRGFVWDNDPFSTNLFAHPYHGNLYFNSARSNGLSFWQSVPYAIGGSLMWEMLAECEPPAINDWIATSLGGTCIGEITNRLSHLILDDSKQGFGRFVREAGAFLVNPIQGFNRIVRGDAFTVRHRHYRYHDYNRIPVEFMVSVGNRYLADDGSLFRGEYSPYVNVGVEYGDALGGEANQPYDYFTADVSLAISGSQPLVNSARLMGRLWGTPIHDGDRLQAQLGIFQHFNFYNSEPVKDGTSLTPYRISEAVGVGPGAIYRFCNVSNVSAIEQRVFLDAILLGGSKSDYYNVIDRDYNMGSGYALKSHTRMDFARLGRFSLDVAYYHIYTWKGYEEKDLTDTNPLYYNVQGDKSDASLVVLNPMFLFHIKGGLNIEFSSRYFIRATNYRYHPNVHAQTFEFKLGVAYRI